MEVVCGDKRQSEIWNLDAEMWSFLEYFAASGTMRHNIYHLYGPRNALKPPKIA